MRYILIAIFFLFSGPLLNAQLLLSDQEFYAEGISKVEVEGSFCEVEVVGTTGDRVSFEGKIEGNRRFMGKVEIKSDLEGGTLKVWLKRSGNIYGRVQGKFLLKIPVKIAIEIATTSGSLRAYDLTNSEILLRCSSGNLHAEDMVGDIELKTSSGNLSALDLEGNVSAMSSSGNLNISEVLGNVSCRSSSGGIRLSNISAAIVNAKSTSGGVRLDDVRAKLNIECSSGSIRGQRVELTDNCFFETTSGSIDLILENEMSDISFDLRANSGGLKVGDNRSEDRLIIKRGDLMVTGRSTSGSQFYRN